jgi:hypothetical protein
MGGWRLPLGGGAPFLEPSVFSSLGLGHMGMGGSGCEHGTKARRQQDVC